MSSLRVYRAISRIGALSYRAKIMIVAFLGTHIPLISLAVYYGFRLAEDWGQALTVMGVTLAATLIGTALTLVALNGLLQPILLASSRLRSYRENRTLPDLPIGYADEAGTLMRDAQATMVQLDRALVRLETLDAATGLPNRAAFSAFLAGNGRTDDTVAVVRLENIDDLRRLFGLEVADEAMAALGARLLTADRAGLGLSRIGPGEFAFLLRADLRDPGAADRAAFDLRGLLTAIGAEIVLATRGDLPVLVPDLRAGLAPVSGGGVPAEEALADSLAAAADATAGAPVRIFTEAGKDAARQRFGIAQDLRRALTRDEFVLHYQPIVDTRRGAPIGCEALVRWQSPERGMVPPGLFIPVAEASGLIDEIGDWVLHRACAEAAGMDAGLRVAVNLSARQFSDPGLPNRIGSALRAASLPADRLELELTETAALADPDHTRRTMAALRDMGLRTAIDDFGTGHASLSALRSLPFDKLKIDREFVSDVDRTPGHQAICAALLALGRGLGIDVLAEGTERQEEVAWLTGAGCHVFQGFHFARPVAAGDLAAVLAALRMPGGAGAADRVA